MITVKPIVKPAYTENGNPYNESNIGKFVAGTSVAGTAVYYGGKFAVKGAKKVVKNAKTIKLDLPKISKANFKSVKEATKNFSAKIPNSEAIKSFIKNIPALLKAEFKNISKLSKKNLKSITKSAKKVNKKNFKKAGNAIVNFAKKPSVRYGAGFVAGLAGVILAGCAVDFILNKISARKADKKA